MSDIMLVGYRIVFVFFIQLVLMTTRTHANANYFLHFLILYDVNLSFVCLYYDNKIHFLCINDRVLYVDIRRFATCFNPTDMSQSRLKEHQNPFEY
jgi:hypothetical protein